MLLFNHPDQTRDLEISRAKATQVLEELVFNKANPDPLTETPDSRKTYTIGDDVITQYENGTGAKHLLYDGHGSTRQLVASDGTTINDSYSYDGYGVMLGGNPTSASPAGTSMLYAGEQFDTSLQMYYNRARYYDQNIGRFNRMDPFAGNNRDPQSLHKYLYVHNNPVNGIDPTGLQGLIGTIVSTAIRQGLMAMAIGSPLRALQMAMDIRAGIGVTDATKNLLIGMTIDFGIGALLGVAGKLLKFCQPTMRLRRAGEVLKRATNSVWKLPPFQRGVAIHRTILGRLPNLASKFPVIDDFYRGVATSIKTLDLTAKTYINNSAMISKLSNYADDLAKFAGKTGGKTPVYGSDITKRVLLIAFEDGAATSTQIQAINQFVQKASTKWPNVKIIFQWI